MNVIAIDFSKKKTGVFFRVDGKEGSGLIKTTKKMSQAQALIEIHDKLGGLLDELKIDFGLLESYVFNKKNVWSIEPMAQVKGAIMMAFEIRGIPLIIIPVQTWKMLTIRAEGKEKNLKNYLAMVLNKYGKLFTSSDEADAYMIYQAAKIIAKKTGRMTESMRKIKDELKAVIERN